jgi:bifunctional DNA-binding transcriptional regulator/antitoxin component of YhaV-PrlF toxin-antitoxin module
LTQPIKPVGETTITGKNQISLPAQGLRELGWSRGDHLLVQIVGDDMLLLMRRPTDWVAAFSGRMGDVFGDHEDTLRYLDEERQSWEKAETRADRGA